MSYWSAAYPNPLTPHSPQHSLFISSITVSLFPQQTQQYIRDTTISCSFSLLSYPVFPPLREEHRNADNPRPNSFFTLPQSRKFRHGENYEELEWGNLKYRVWLLKNLLFVWPARAAEGLACVINYNNGRSLKWTCGSNVWSRVW